jgi:hypothetical protein
LANFETSAVENCRRSFSSSSKNLAHACPLPSSQHAPRDDRSGAQSWRHAAAHQSPSGWRFTTLMRWRIMNRPASFATRGRGHPRHTIA